MLDQLLGALVRVDVAAVEIRGERRLGEVPRVALDLAVVVGGHCLRHQDGAERRALGCRVADLDHIDARGRGCRCDGADGAGHAERVGRDGRHGHVLARRGDAQDVAHAEILALRGRDVDGGGRRGGGRRQRREAGCELVLEPLHFLALRLARRELHQDRRQRSRVGLELLDHRVHVDDPLVLQDHVVVDYPGQHGGHATFRSSGLGCCDLRSDPSARACGGAGCRRLFASVS